MAESAVTVAVQGALFGPRSMLLVRGADGELIWVERPSMPAEDPVQPAGSGANADV